MRGGEKLVSVAKGKEPDGTGDPDTREATYEPCHQFGVRSHGQRTPPGMNLLQEDELLREASNGGGVGVEPGLAGDTMPSRNRRRHHLLLGVPGSQIASG